MPPEHICWGTSEWFAWDLWNQVPGFSDHFSLMLNGGFAYVPKVLAFDAGFQDNKIIVPEIHELDPSLGATHPLHPVCGVWVMEEHYGDTIEWFHEDDGDGEAWFSMASHSWRNERDGCLRFLHRIYDVLPIEEVTEDERLEMMLATGWAQSQIGNERLQMDPEPFADLMPELETLQEQLHEQKLEWMSFLHRMAPRHECAAHQLRDAMQEDTYRLEKVVMAF